MSHATQSSPGERVSPLRGGIGSAPAPFGSVACAVAAAAMLAYGGNWMSDAGDEQGLAAHAVNDQSGGRVAPSSVPSGRDMWSPVPSEVDASRGAAPARLAAIAASSGAPSQHVKPHFEWQIGVDPHDGRALYTAWAAWLRTQNRSRENVETLGVALEGADGDLRTDVAAAAVAARDSDGLAHALAGANLSNLEIATVGQDIAGTGPAARTDLLRSAADANSSVMIQALIDLQQVDPSGYRDALADTMGFCPASSLSDTCWFLSSVAMMSPTAVDRLLSASAADAVVCGMPRSVPDFRSILTSDGSARWCASAADQAQTGGV